MRVHSIIVLAGCTLAALTRAEAAADERAKAEQGRIPFANLGGIQDWRAPDDDTLYVQGRNRQWYRAELFGPCSGLDFAHTIGFVVEPTGSFDRFSSIMVDGRQCKLRSFVETEPPSQARERAAQAPSSGDNSTDNSAKAHKGGNLQRTASSSSEAASQSARIPFANLGGIENWHAEDNDTLYIEGRRGQWYRAELFAPCFGLQFETAIGFVAEPTGSFDRFSSIVVDGRECRVKSLTESAPPAKG